MYIKEKLLQMIVSDKASTRYDACEWLRIRPESSPEIVYALWQATHDLDPEVATRAELALQADVHHQMSIQMGLIPPDPVKSAPQFIEESAGIEPLPESNLPQVITAMTREIRSWGWWSVGMGVIHLFASGFLSADWGILLILVGLASFLFRTSAMFIVYGVTLLWAAISNLSSLQAGWGVFAILQFYFVTRIFMDFHRFHKAEQAYLATGTVSPIHRDHASRAGSYFPWIGSVLGCSSVIGFTVWFVGVALLTVVASNAARYDSLLNFIGGILWNLGVLAFAVGLASILSGYRPKVVGIIAIISGAIMLAVQIIFMLL